MQKIFYRCICLIFLGVNVLQAQLLTDDFTDGDFTNNPTWTGNTDVFTVNGLGQLQLNASVAGTSFLVTTVNLGGVDDIEWNIRVRQNFAPSNSNRGRIYLASNNENLTATSAINAFYLQLGEDLSNDVVDLFRQNGNTRTSIARGTFNISQAFHIDIKVTRQTGGVWNIFVKSVTDTNFGTADATVTDNTTLNGTHFGVVCIYTVTNAKNFFFDNITITSLPDVSPPSVTGVTASTATTLGIVFSENVSITSAINLSNYQTDIGTPVQASASGNTANLTFGGSFLPNTPYSLTVNGIMDLSGNLMAANSVFNFTFAGSGPPASTSSGLYFRQIVINEVMADPSTVLGNAEYMEIYNTTNEVVALQGLTLFESGNHKSFPTNLSISGNGYIVVTNPNALQNLQQAIPDKTVISLTGLSNSGWLTNGGETLTLSVSGGNVVDVFTYTSSSKGVAWEQINPFLNTTLLSNWALSTNTNGGTPGEQNSVFTTVTGGGGSTTSGMVFDFRQIVINEVMADINPAPAELPPVDYIELRNNLSTTVNLQGMVLRDFASTGTFVDRTITGVVTVPANGFLVLCSNSARTSLLGFNPTIPIFSFSSLDPSNDDRFHLFDAFGNLVDSIRYTTAWYQNSTKSSGGWALEQINPTLNFSAQSNWIASESASGGTPGEENSVYSTLTGSVGGGSSVGSPLAFRQLVINEIMPDPSPTLGLPNFEYIEIFNNSDTTVNLSNLILIESNSRRNFPAGLTIAGGGYLVVCNNNALTEFTEALPGKQVVALTGLSSSGWLTNGGETLILSVAGGNLIDSYTYTTAPKGYAWEQINPESPCSGRNNWKTSTNPVGGTPADINSVFNNVSDNPLIVSTRATLANQVLLVFNQPLDTLSFNTATYKADSNLIATWQYVRTRSTDSLYLNVNGVLKLGRPYGFTVTGLKNCTGGLLSNGIFQTGIGRQPQPKEVVINEIYADEDPSYGLPDGEFVELFNTTNDLIDISNFLFLDNTASSRGRLGNNVVLQPNEYLIICASSQAAKYEPYGRVAIVSNWPSLNSTNEVLRLANVSTVTIDRIAYTDKWYRDDTKKTGGYTLERINPFTDCGGRYNWIASVNTIGGTPGKQNSVYNIGNSPDKPILTNVILRDRSTLFLSFNKGLRSDFDIANASLSSRQLSAFQFFGADNDSLAFSLNTPIDSGVVYLFSIKDVKDCSGNLSDFTSQLLGVGKKANPNDIVINEIMADESPVVALPEAEFVELHNVTNFLLDISNFRLFDNGATPGRLPASAVIKPNGFVILCATSRVNDFKPYGDTYGVTSFPSLNNSGESLTLRNPQGERISQVTYSNTWYGDAVKRDGGWTLERVDPLNPCGTANNWTASTDPSGGTPGRQNSVFARNPDQTAPKLTRAFAFAPDSLLLYFNEALDSLSAVNAPISISDNVSVVNRIVGLDKILCTLTPPLQVKTPYTVQITQVTDCSGNFIAGDNKRTFYLAEQADSNDVIINEILFNPRVGGSDFVEIYNRSNKYINLKNWKISNARDDARAIIDDNHLLMPNEFRVITNNVLDVKNNYPNAIDTNFMEIRTMPSYPDREGTAKIIMNTGALSDVFDYHERFHLRLIDNKNGVSLERISYDLPTNTSENWASASQNIGFATPGYKNSQHSKVDFSDNLVDITPKIFTPDQDGIDDMCFINFNIKGINNIANITIFDMEGRIVRHLVRNVNISQQGFFQWDGSNDDGRKALVGNYLVWVEVFNPQGEVQRFKQNVVVGARF